ncbi:MAG: hypothetical protein WAN39_02650 [Candidatus Cybelea sp.]
MNLNVIHHVDGGRDQPSPNGIADPQRSVGLIGTRRYEKAAGNESLKEWEGFVKGLLCGNAASVRKPDYGLHERGGLRELANELSGASINDP